MSFFYEQFYLVSKRDLTTCFQKVRLANQIKFGIQAGQHIAQILPISGLTIN